MSFILILVTLIGFIQVVYSIPTIFNKFPENQTHSKTHQKLPTYLKSIFFDYYDINYSQINIDNNRNEDHLTKLELSRSIFPIAIKEFQDSNDKDILEVNFDLSKNQGEKIQNAKVILTLMKQFEIDDASSFPLNISISYGDLQLEYEKKMVKAGQIYLELDITSLLNDSLFAPQNFETLEIKVRSRPSSILSQVINIEDDPPFLFLQFQNSILTHTKPTKESSESSCQNKVKRSINPFQDNFRCQYHDLELSPIDLGLDNIVFPYELNLGYCSGECPFPLENEFYNFTSYAIFVGRLRMNKKYRDRDNVPEATCTPAAFKPIKLIVYDPEKDQYAIETYKYGAVAFCGCR